MAPVERSRLLPQVLPWSVDRAYRIWVDDEGYPPEDLIFDPNVFAVSTGIPEHNAYAMAFIEAC